MTPVVGAEAEVQAKRESLKRTFSFRENVFPSTSDMTPPPICQFMVLQGDSLTAALQLNPIEANGHVAPAPLLEGQKKLFGQVS
jgi:hypothetical protein